MSYSKQHFLSDLFLELKNNYNFEDTILRNIVNISSDIKQFLEVPRGISKITSRISIRVFEIIALEYYDKSLTPEDIPNIAEKIVNTKFDKGYYPLKKELDSNSKKLNKFGENFSIELKYTLLEKFNNNDKYNSALGIKVLEKVINEFNLDWNGYEINSEYIEEESFLSKEQDKLQLKVYDILSSKIFIENIENLFYENIIDLFYEENINLNNLEDNFSFSIINQYIYSYIFDYYSENLNLNFENKYIYSLDDFRKVITKLKLEDSLLYDNSIIDNIYNKIKSSIGNIENNNLNNHFNKWLRDKIINITNNFLFDIKLQNSYDFLNKKEEYHKSDLKSEELIHGKKGDIIYNYNGFISDNNLVTIEDTKKVKDNISLLFPNKHNYENNILDLYKGFENKIKNEDFIELFNNLISNPKDISKYLIQFTNGVQSIKILNKFYLYLQKQDLLKENKELFDNILEIVIEKLYSQNIGERFENNSQKSFKRINLVLFYLGYGVGNSGLKKVYQNSRINSQFEKKLILKITKLNENIINEYREYLVTYLEGSGNLLKNHINIEKKVNNYLSPNVSDIRKTSFKNQIQYINIFNFFENLKIIINDKVENKIIKKLLLEYIRKLKNFENINISTTYDKFTFINTDNLISQLLSVFIKNNFSYNIDFIIKNTYQGKNKDLEHINDTIYNSFEHIINQEDNYKKWIEDYSFKQNKKEKLEKEFFEKINIFKKKHKEQIEKYNKEIEKIPDIIKKRTIIEEKNKNSINNIKNNISIYKEIERNLKNEVSEISGQLRKLRKLKREIKKIEGNKENIDIKAQLEEELNYFKEELNKQYSSENKKISESFLNNKLKILKSELLKNDEKLEENEFLLFEYNEIIQSFNNQINKYKSGKENKIDIPYESFFKKETEYEKDIKEILQINIEIQKLKYYISYNQSNYISKQEKLKTYDLFKISKEDIETIINLKINQ